jgi:hypothetical protein
LEALALVCLSHLLEDQVGVFTFLIWVVVNKEDVAKSEDLKYSKLATFLTQTL